MKDEMPKDVSAAIKRRIVIGQGLYARFPKTSSLLASLASQALEATRHLLEMYRRQLSNEKTRGHLHRLGKRLLSVHSQLQMIYTAGK